MKNFIKKIQFKDCLGKSEHQANTSIVICLTTKVRIEINFNSQLLYQLSYRGIAILIYIFFIPKSNSDEFLMNLNLINQKSNRSYSLI